MRARASQNELGGFRDGRLQVKVTAPPVGGKANRALCRLIAKSAGVPQSRVSVERGASSRDKLVRVVGIDEAELRKRLSGTG